LSLRALGGTKVNWLEWLLLLVVAFVLLVPRSYAQRLQITGSTEVLGFFFLGLVTAFRRPLAATRSTWFALGSSDLVMHVAGAVLCAGFFEVLQDFVGRGTRWTDFLTNTIAVVVGATIATAAQGLSRLRRAASRLDDERASPVTANQARPGSDPPARLVAAVAGAAEPLGPARGEYPLELGPAAVLTGLAPEDAELPRHDGNAPAEGLLGEISSEISCEAYRHYTAEMWQSEAARWQAAAERWHSDAEKGKLEAERRIAEWQKRMARVDAALAIAKDARNLPLEELLSAIPGASLDAIRRKLRDARRR